MAQDTLTAQNADPLPGCTNLVRPDDHHGVHRFNLRPVLGTVSTVSVLP